MSLRGSVAVDEKTRRARVTFATTTPVKRFGSSGPYLEELSLDPRHVRLGRLNQGAPFLANHNGYDVARTLGVVERAWIENGEGKATIRFAKAEDDPEADKVFRKIKDGIITSVSVGYRVHKLEKISGGEGQTPTFRATDWEPFEISAVALPADPNAGFRSTRSPTQDEKGMKMHQNGGGEVDLAAREVERVHGIRAICRRHDLEADLENELVKSGMSLDKARDQILEVLAARSDAGPPSQKSGPDDHYYRGRIQVGTSADEKFRNVAVAGVIEKLGGTNLVIEAAKRGVRGLENDVHLDGGEFRGLTMPDIARETLERRGDRTRGMTRDALVGRALTIGGALSFRSGGLAGTSDLPVLLENAMGKILLAAYSTANDTWRFFCGKTTVPDFRASPRYRNGSFGSLDVVNEHGEFKNKPIPDGSKTSVSASTKGNMIGISRQAIVNDDMGALGDLLQRLGRGAALSIEKDVYALLNANSGLGPNVDANPFFHSSRGNVNGTGSALGVAGIDADRVVMASQLDISGNDFLDLRPSVLLVPVALGGQARVLNSAEYDVSQTNKFQVPNMVRGLFKTVIDTPRLTHATRRYLFADPSEAPAIMVAFLEGQGEAPFLETQNGWRVDGTEMKVRLDYGVQVFDPRGAVTNVGA